MTSISRRAVLALATTCLALAASAQQKAPSRPRTVRLRGTLEAVSDTQLTLRERSGQTVQLAVSPKLSVSEVYPVTLADIKPGVFVGVGAMPQADGTERAIAVTVFPEAMRGTGEGHYPFDFLPQSMMTNATVAEVAAAPNGEKLQLQFKGGEQTIIVPPQAPIVSFRPSDRSLLVPGAAVAVSVQEIDGKPTAMRVSAGRNGFRPPY
jgi:hypothetical protein